MVNGVSLGLFDFESQETVRSTTAKKEMGKGTMELNFIRLYGAKLYGLA